MAVSYKKLWKLLIDKDIKKKDLSDFLPIIESLSVRNIRLILVECMYRAQNSVNSAIASNAFPIQRKHFASSTKIINEVSNQPWIDLVVGITILFKKRPK